jgi:hypothetical protein
VGVAAAAGAATNPLRKRRSQKRVPVKKQGGRSKQGGNKQGGNKQGASGSQMWHSRRLCLQKYVLSAKEKVQNKILSNERPMFPEQSN